MTQPLNANPPVNQAVNQTAPIVDALPFALSNVKVPGPDEVRDYLGISS